MRTKPLMKTALYTTLLLALVAVAPAFGQGRIIPDRIRPAPGPVRETPLHLKYLDVNAEITDGVAVTTVKQTFHNVSGRQIEGTYVFPLPADAAVGDFQMTMNGQTLRGEVLDQDAARQAYEEIVRRLRDPALLEYLGDRMYRASIFPIPPGGLVEIQLSYTQTLTATGGLGAYRYPLRGIATDRPVERCTVRATLKSQVPLTSVFCPSHNCDIQRPSDRTATVTYEGAQVSETRDLQLYYLLGNGAIGLTLLTHRAAGEDGYFLLRLSPPFESRPDLVQPKDIAFVVDVSGSMQGEKIKQARQALQFCINSLNAQDRFNILTFSTAVRAFREGLVPASADIKTAALGFADGIQAIGGTNINQALLNALAADPGDSARPYLIVFLTDGQPTVGVTDAGRILDQVAAANSQRVRFHVLGVGADVNTHLLDRLAELNSGSREYCDVAENLELKLSALAGRIANPALTDIALDVPGAQLHDQYPAKLPDLFHGGELVVLGRYQAAGQTNITVTGLIADQRQHFTYPAAFPQQSRENDFLPRLWAHRKVAYLLDQIRLQGHNQELVNEVKHLARRFGIVTPYTAALVLEDTALAGAAARDQVFTQHAPRAEVVRTALGGGGGRSAAATGRDAVQASQDIDAAKHALTLPPDERGSTGAPPALRHVADKTFVRERDRWIDTAWDRRQTPQIIVAFSTEYFELLRAQPHLARFFTVGEHVLVVSADVVYEVVPAPDAP